MTLEAFLAEGKSHEQEQQGGGEFPTIAKVQIRWAYRSGFAKTSKYFPYSYGDDEGSIVAEAQCKAQIGSDKWNDGKQKEPVHGFFTEIYGDDVPTSKGGSWRTDIWKEFIPSYENDETFTNMAKKLSDKIKNSVYGPMPYTAIVNSLMEINAPVKLFGEPTWCKLSKEIDQWNQLKVNQGTLDPRTYEGKEVPYEFWLIRKVYENELDARVDAEAINGGQAISKPQAANKMSAKGTETWGTVVKLQARKKKIETMILAATKGIGTPNDKKLSPEQAREFVIIGHGIEESDLLLIGIKELKKSPVEAHVTKHELITEDEIPF